MSDEGVGAPAQAFDEGGFTLAEMIIVIMIYGIVLAAGIGFVTMQNTLFHRGLDRMTALQNMRYALSSLETDISALGTNVPVSQPSLVYADVDVIAFTGDYASNVPGDVFAAYIDPSAPNGRVTVPDPSVTIPNSDGFTWPETLYLGSGGTRSPAELLILWFALDTTTARTDDYVLFRQVNGGSPEPLARNILQRDTTPFFQYSRRVDLASTPSSLVQVDGAYLPVIHTSTFHRVAADTAASAVVDAIRAVRVTFRSTNGLSGDQERVVSASRLIDMPNAGFPLMRTCGDEPIIGDALGVVLVDRGGGDFVSRLTWTAAVDETAGERDVVRYVIYRQRAPITADWGDPYVSVPAGLERYTYDDGLIVSGETYRYAVAAQDCTPMLSPVETSPLIIVP